MLIGRITKDAEVKMTPGGQAVANFGLATNNVWVDKAGQKQESTEFHNLVLWGKRAEALGPYLTKGKLVLIQGTLRNRSWLGTDNQKKWKTEIFVSDIQFGPRSSNDGAGFAPKTADNKEEIDEMKEELPVITADEAADSPFESDIEGDEIPF